MPGMEKICSIMIEPPMIPMNSPRIIGRIGTIAFLIAWRTIAWFLVSPFVRASSR